MGSWESSLDNKMSQSLLFWREENQFGWSWWYAVLLAPFEKRKAKILFSSKWQRFNNRMVYFFSERLNRISSFRWIKNCRKLSYDTWVVFTAMCVCIPRRVSRFYARWSTHSHCAQLSRTVSGFRYYCFSVRSQVLCHESYWDCLRALTALSL